MAEYVEGCESAVQNACQIGVEKLFSERFKALKTFVSGIDVLLNLSTGFRKSLVFQMAPLVPSSEPYGRSNKFVTEIWYISRLDKRR